MTANSGYIFFTERGVDVGAIGAAMVKHVLLVGMSYDGPPIDDISIESLGLCRPSFDFDRAAYALYEYDLIIINPAGYSDFILGSKGEFSDELHRMRSAQGNAAKSFMAKAFSWSDRSAEMERAIAGGTTVVWCLSAPKRQYFYGMCDTHLGYVAPDIAALVDQADLQVRKGRSIRPIQFDNPFFRYFEVLNRSGWSFCLGETPEGYHSIASSMEGQSLAGRIDFADTIGWLVTPPTSQEAADQLVRDAVQLGRYNANAERFHAIHLSHTAADKPFVTRLQADLKANGVNRVMLEEVEVEAGDSISSRIEEGLKVCRHVGMAITKKYLRTPWYKMEVYIAMNKAAGFSGAAFLPLLYEACDIPDFLQGRKFADFTNPASYSNGLAALLGQLRIS
jgi:hypothetical protein